VTTGNYNTISARDTKSFPACSVFSRCFLIMASNNEDSSPSVLMLLLSSEYPATELSSKLCPFYNPSAQTAQKTQFFYCCVCVYVLPSNSHCLPSHGLETGLVYPLQYFKTSFCDPDRSNPVSMFFARAKIFSCDEPCHC
jgi:hypothetical protein